MSSARVVSARITIQRRALAARLRLLGLVTFSAGVGGAAALGGNLALGAAGVAAFVALVAWARRLSTAAPAFPGSLSPSPGEVVVHREGHGPTVVGAITAGWVVPVEGGARVELVRDDDDAVTVDVATADEGHALLAAAGVDPSRRALRVLLGGRWDGVGYGVVTALFVLLQGTPLFVLVALALHLTAGATAMLGVGLLVLALWLGGRMLGPSEITLGADGVGWRHGFSRGFARWRDVLGVEAWHDQGILLRRRGAPVIIPHARKDRDRIAGVVTLLRRAWARATVDPRASLDALDRQGRTLDAWRQALRSLLANASYRQGSLTPDDLVATLHDPAASPERRFAAALCLRDVDAPAAVTRIRVAAEACASDELRDALERVALGTADDATAARVTGR